MLVIGTMALLFAIAASVIAAAYANLNDKTRQNEINNIRILSESIHRNILFALENDPGNTDSLSYQLIMDLYNYSQANDGAAPSDMSVHININATPINPQIPSNLSIQKLTFSWLSHDVRVVNAQPYIQGIPGDVDEGIIEIPDVPRRPKTAVINATLIVTLDILAEKGIGVTDRVITTIATYEYRDGLLTQEYDSEYDDKDESMNTVYEMGFATEAMGYDEDYYGTWTLITYETFDGAG